MTSEPDRTPDLAGEPPKTVDDRTAGSNQARETGAALEAHYRFILWLVPAVERFPRNRKFLLGDRIQTTALDVLERLIETCVPRTATGTPPATATTTTVSVLPAHSKAGTGRATAPPGE